LYHIQILFVVFKILCFFWLALLQDLKKMFQDVKVDFRSLQTQFLDDMVKLGTLFFFFEAN